MASCLRSFPGPSAQFALWLPSRQLLFPAGEFKCFWIIMSKRQYSGNINEIILQGRIVQVLHHHRDRNKYRFREKKIEIYEIRIEIKIQTFTKECVSRPLKSTGQSVILNLWYMFLYFLFLALHVNSSSCHYDLFLLFSVHEIGHNLRIEQANRSVGTIFTEVVSSDSTFIFKVLKHLRHF